MEFINNLSSVRNPRIFQINCSFMDEIIHPSFLENEEKKENLNPQKKNLQLILEILTKKNSEEKIQNRVFELNNIDRIPREIGRSSDRDIVLSFENVSRFQGEFSGNKNGEVFYSQQKKSTWTFVQVKDLKIENLKFIYFFEIPPYISVYSEFEKESYEKIQIYYYDKNEGKVEVKYLETQKKKTTKEITLKLNEKYEIRKNVYLKNNEGNLFFECINNQKIWRRLFDGEKYKLEDKEIIILFAIQIKVSINY